MVKKVSQYIIETISISYFTSSIFVENNNFNNENLSSSIVLCDQNNDDGFFAGIFFLILGLLIFYNTLKNLKKKRLFENIPTSKMRSLAMGLIELKGKIVGAKIMIKDPFDQKECVYWSVTIEEYVKRGKRSKWVTRHKASDSVPFSISDETGSVLIHTAKADMSNIKRDNSYEAALLFTGDLPKHIKQYCYRNNVKYDGWIGRRKMRCRTTYLEIKDQLYVIGNARPIKQEEKAISDKATAAIEYIKGGFYIISDKSEKELIDDHGGQSWLVPLGVVLSAIGLSFILTTIGYL